MPLVHAPEHAVIIPPLIRSYDWIAPIRDAIIHNEAVFRVGIRYKLLNCQYWLIRSTIDSEDDYTFWTETIVRDPIRIGVYK